MENILQIVLSHLSYLLEWKGMLFGVMLTMITGFALWEYDAGVMSSQGQL